MRIIGGQFRGRKLVEFPGADIRPTGDRIKESLFNILSPRLYGARVLDLFCGSGALGLESLSRGAREVVFNDGAKSSLDVLKKNIALIKPDEKSYRILNSDCMFCLKSLQGAFDIIFIDPPYRSELGMPCLELIGERGLLSQTGVAVYERDTPCEALPDGWAMCDERRYGRTKLYFLNRSENL